MPRRDTVLPPPAPCGTLLVVVPRVPAAESPPLPMVHAPYFHVNARNRFAKQELMNHPFCSIKIIPGSHLLARLETAERRWRAADQSHFWRLCKRSPFKRLPPHTPVGEAEPSSWWVSMEKPGEEPTARRRPRGAELAVHGWLRGPLGRGCQGFEGQQEHPGTRQPRLCHPSVWTDSPPAFMACFIPRCKHQNYML